MNVANGDLDLEKKEGSWRGKRDTESLTPDLTNSGGDLASIHGDGRVIDLDV